MNGNENLEDLCDLFFGNLDGLDIGDRAILKRCAGTMLSGENRGKGQAMRVFYQCIPSREIKGWREECFFAVACMYCLKKDRNLPREKFQDMLGRLIGNGTLSNSTAHRVENLIDTSGDYDGYMVRKLYRLAVLLEQKNTETQINYKELLRDLCYWNSEYQYVQRKWAKAVFAGIKTK